MEVGGLSIIGQKYLQGAIYKWQKIVDGKGGLGIIEERLWMGEGDL